MYGRMAASGLDARNDADGAQVVVGFRVYSMLRKCRSRTFRYCNLGYPLGEGPGVTTSTTYLPQFTLILSAMQSHLPCQLELEDL